MTPATCSRSGGVTTSQVLRPNPARNFYLRLGFEQVGETTTHFLMARPPGTPRAGCP
jgi:hypothetical protein